MLCLRLTWTSRLQCSFVPWCSRGKRAEANKRQTDNETCNQQQIRIGNVTKTSWIWRQPTQQNIEQVSKLYPRDAMLACLVLSCLDNCYKPRTEYHTNETGSLHTRSVPVACSEQVTVWRSPVNCSSLSTWSAEQLFQSLMTVLGKKGRSSCIQWLKQEYILNLYLARYYSYDQSVPIAYKSVFYWNGCTDRMGFWRLALTYWLSALYKGTWLWIGMCSKLCTLK